MKNLIRMADNKGRQEKSLRKATQRLVKESDLSEEDLLDMIDIYDSWKVDIDVVKDEHYKYEDNLYQVIQAHTTQEDWTPDSVPALFNKVVPDNVIPEFVQPTGAHDAYSKGDRITFEGSLYESLINSNAYSPTDYAQGWKKIEE